MSKKSSATSRAASRKQVEQPFDPHVWDKAHKRAVDYHITLEKNHRLGFIGNCVELPNVYADGADAQGCYEAALEAVTVAVAAMLESGQRPPVPAGAGKRTLQVNVRLTPEEKALLSNASAILGFSGLSDFMRNSAMEKVAGSATVLGKMMAQESS